MAGTASAHGAIVNPDEIALTRNELDWTEEPFEIPDEVYSAWDAKGVWYPQRRKLEPTIRRL